VTGCFGQYETMVGRDGDASSIAGVWKSLQQSKGIDVAYVPVPRHEMQANIYCALIVGDNDRHHHQHHHHQQQQVSLALALKKLVWVGLQAMD